MNLHIPVPKSRTNLPHIYWHMLRISSNEMLAEDLTVEEIGISVEESLEMEHREELLMRESDGCYPEWDEMKDQKLVEALLLLREDERKLIYQHVFEERTFDDISRINGLPPYKVKGILKKCCSGRRWETM